MAALLRDPVAPVPRDEVYGPIFRPVRDMTMPIISYGLPFDKAVIKHIPIDARVFIIASKTLSEKSDALARLQTALGQRVKGTHIGMTRHTLFHECVQVTERARKVQADHVVTLGGGSLSDAAKYVCKALNNKLDTVEELARHNHRIGDDRSIASEAPESNPSLARLICIPTSLSAGEHTPFAGITEATSKRKYQIHATQATATILDPWLALQTPVSVWVQSGVRAIDHCVEMGMSPRAFPEVYEAVTAGLKLLIPGLYETIHDTANTNVEARLNAQIGSTLAIMPLLWRVPAGASHGIGHMLGPMGVGHGETSCILLPAICKYNANATVPQQAMLRNTLWEVPICQELFATKGLKQNTSDLGDLLDAIIREFGMPRTLKEKNITGDQIEALAEMSLEDQFLKVNPIPITTKEQVLEILNNIRE